MRWRYPGPAHDGWRADGAGAAVLGVDQKGEAKTLPDQSHLSYESTYLNSRGQGEERGARDGGAREHAIGTVSAFARQDGGIGGRGGARVALHKV